MISLDFSHDIISRRLCRKFIALVQVLVMLMLAVPAFCYEPEPGHEKENTVQTAKAEPADDECPCCPGENTADAPDTCSSCSYCSSYTPLTPVISTTYDPAVTALTFPEQLTKLTDVHIPIFVPPQNFL